jgi:thioredoxin reductase
MPLTTTVVFVPSAAQFLYASPDLETSMSDQPNALIVGDGPAGLSAALLLAKNGVDVDVLGTDQTPMHKALLLNYLGIKEITGTAFQERSREQVADFGARLHDSKVVDLGSNAAGFTVETDDGETFEADYIVIGTTNDAHLKALDVDMADGVADVDRNGRTSVEDCYAVGWATRSQKIQAIISAGDGAAAALDILSDIAGEPVHDFDVVE